MNADQCHCLAALLRAKLERYGPLQWAEANGRPHMVLDDSEVIYVAGDPPGFFSVEAVAQLADFLEQAGGLETG